jgi:heme-degrading monooxygenase HmoA
MNVIAEGLEAPYYVAAFATNRGPNMDRDAEAIGRMIRLATRTEGFLGLETANRDDGTTVMRSYWETAEALDRWKLACDGALAESCGLQSWYHAFGLSVRKVERHPLFKWIRRAA